MGVVEDVRSVIQDLVAPALKSQAVLLESSDKESKLRDDSLLAKLESSDKESKLRDDSLLAKLESSDKESKLRDESLSAKLESAEQESKLRDESLAWEAKVREELILAKLETQNAKIEALGAKMDYQYASIMNALNLDRRLEVLEREKQAASA